MADWNQAYANGVYDGWGETESSPRFALIGGLCTQARAADILDVGCGTGLLRASLCLSSSRYTGLDSSSVVIQCLQDKGNGDFICADAEQWIPSRVYDAVILNEVLYYFKNPRAATFQVLRCTLSRWHFHCLYFQRRTSFWHPNPNRRALEFVEDFLPSAARYQVIHCKDTWVVFACRK